MVRGYAMIDEIPDVGQMVVELVAIAIDVRTSDDTRKRIAKTLKDLSDACENLERTTGR